MHSGTLAQSSVVPAERAYTHAMALIVRGSTKCAACGRVLTDDDEVAGLPHFAADPSDPLWKYSDAGFHRQCFDSLTERAEIERRIDALRRL